MIFNIELKKTKDESTITRINMAVGSKICGLCRNGNRPNSVELTYYELLYLLNNKDYALKVVLPALYIPSKEINNDS